MRAVKLKSQLSSFLRCDFGQVIKSFWVSVFSFLHDFQYGIITGQNIVESIKKMYVKTSIAT